MHLKYLKIRISTIVPRTKLLQVTTNIIIVCCCSQKNSQCQGAVHMNKIKMVEAGNKYFEFVKVLSR